MASEQEGPAAEGGVEWERTVHRRLAGSGCSGDAGRGGLRTRLPRARPLLVPRIPGPPDHRSNRQETAGVHHPSKIRVHFPSPATPHGRAQRRRSSARQRAGVSVDAGQPARPDCPSLTTPQSPSPTQPGRQQGGPPSATPPPEAGAAPAGAHVAAPRGSIGRGPRRP